MAENNYLEVRHDLSATPQPLSRERDCGCKKHPGNRNLANPHKSGQVWADAHWARKKRTLNGFF